MGLKASFTVHTGAQRMETSTIYIVNIKIGSELVQLAAAIFIEVHAAIFECQQWATPHGVAS
jgi:hypothetical protein